MTASRFTQFSDEELDFLIKCFEEHDNCRLLDEVLFEQSCRKEPTSTRKVSNIVNKYRLKSDAFSRLSYD